MKRMKRSTKILMVPILLGLLFGVAGCCVIPWDNGDRGSHHDGERGDHHESDGHDHHHDGGRD